MVGIALEGGGALGAYHVGVMKALYAEGCHFDGYVGTSIGAINAAALAQGDFARLEQLWDTISTEELFSEPIARLLSLGEYPLSDGLNIDLPKLLGAVRHGVDTTKMKSVIGSLLDEPKLRASGIDFGLVAVRLSGLKACEMWLSDIPDGQLLDWLMASASFPGFRPEVIDGKTYVDGGLRNNCPINLLTDRGYDHVYAIRTYGPGLFRMPETSAKITLIAPTQSLGNVMLFERAQSQRNMRLGYLDARRALGRTVGRAFYVKPDRKLDGFGLLAAVDEDCIRQIAEWYPIEHTDMRRLLFECVLPDLAIHLQFSETGSYADLALSLMESAAGSLGMDALKEYALTELIQAVASADCAAQSDDVDAAALIGDHRPAIIRMLAHQIATRLPTI